MKRMLFNATQQEELRVAIVDGQKLIDIDIESNSRELHKSNIYKAVITRIEPSLEACFVNYGEDRHGFLPFKEVARSLFKDGVDIRSAAIKDAMAEGQEIMVQVEKEERGNKGAALTTFVSLAGRYLVLMPNNPRGGGVSRRVEGEERQELREAMDKLEVPAGMSIIARTAGIGRSTEELQWDLNYLLQLWNAIEGAGNSAPGAFLIYHESSLVIRAIRDYFQPDIGEILIDTDEIYEQARQFMSHVMPDMVNRVKRYRDDVPLFSRFQIEHQIETAYSRVVSLPSGGSIVIDHTEALVAVDVNSARSTRGTDIETTAFNTNCEAAEEVARQLRLRDLGGLIVIDFIDMESAKNRREIENRLKEALHYDRARVQMDKITRFGLMELSRQRLRPSLSEGSHITCPRCNGTGHIRDTESSALQVLRIIEEESMKESSAVIHVQIPVDVAAFLLNEKRGEIMKVENRHKVEIVLIPNTHLETPHYKLERIKHDDPRLEEPQVSYKLAEQSDDDMSFAKRQKEPVKPVQEAMVKNIPEGIPAPVVERKPAVEEQGFFSKLLGIFGIGKEETPAEPAEKTVKNNARKGRNNDRNRNRNRNRGEREDKVRTPASPATPSAVAQEADETDNANASHKRSRRSRNGERNDRQREDRRPARNEENADLSEATTTSVAKPGARALVPVSEAVQVIAGETETVTENDATERTGGEEETRRRRRRGGRNRNRRDPNAEPMDQTDEIVSAETVAEPVVASADASFTKETTAESVEQSEVQSGEEAPARREGRRSHPRRRNSNRAEAEVKEVTAEDAVIIENDSAETPVMTETGISSTAAKSGKDSPAVSEALVEPVVTEIDTAQTVPADTISETPVAVETVSDGTTTVRFVAENVIEVETVSVQATVAAPSAADASAELDRILAEAGLTMASTDPEKLQKVQQNAPVEADAVKAPVRRSRKKVVIDDGPLVQVDTRKE